MTADTADADRNEPLGELLKSPLKLVLRYNKLPTALILRGVRCTETELPIRGGFADVFIGEFRNKRVALKRVRDVPSSGAGPQGIPIESRKVRARNIAFERAVSSPVVLRLQVFNREVLVWTVLSDQHILSPLGVSPEACHQSSMCIVLPWMSNGTINQYKNKLKEEGKLSGSEFQRHIDRWVNEIVET